MKIIFKAYCDDELISFTTNCKMEAETLVFIDEVNPETKIRIYKEKGLVVLERQGATRQKLFFDLTKETEATYENDFGLKLAFMLRTKASKWENDYFFFSYELLLEGDLVSKHKIIGKITK